MTDIVERMKATACPDNTGCMSIKTCVCDVMGDAVDEIERLRLTVMNLCVANGKLEDERDDLHEEVKRLEKSLKWEQNWLSRIGTHSPGCWAWGPAHYQCAIHHIEELSNAS